VLQQAQLEMILKELLVQNINLPSFDSRFANQLTHNSEGVFYMDNARNIDKASGLWYYSNGKGGGLGATITCFRFVIPKHDPPKMVSPCEQHCESKTTQLRHAIIVALFGKL
jgi:hypothetical protein